MTSKLQAVVDRIEHLPEAAQAEAAERIAALLDELEDRAWQVAFADPASDAFFASAEAEIEQAQREGTLTPLFPSIEDGE